MFNIRVPREGWRPDGWDPASVRSKPLVTTADVSASNAIRTRAFWLLWIVLFGNVTAGIGILEQASPMIQDFFRDNGTSSVAVAAAAGFVGVLSLFNMAGRFAWSSTSDVIGINGFLDAQGKPGTLTAAAYRPALFTMVGVLAVGFLANLLIRPVPERYHEPEKQAEEVAA